MSHEGREERFDLEVSKEVARILPEGWSLRKDVLDTFDIVAESPTGTIYPIEVKSGKGLLDVSTVVGFGAGIKEIATVDSYGDRDVVFKRTSIDEAIKIPVDRDDDEIAVKPLIVTERTLGSASSDYAEDFHIDIVALTTGKKRSEEPSGVVGLARELVERLELWESRIQQAEDEVAEASPEPAHDWYRLPLKQWSEAKWDETT